MRNKSFRNICHEIYYKQSLYTFRSVVDIITTNKDMQQLSFGEDNPCG